MYSGIRRQARVIRALTDRISVYQVLISGGALQCAPVFRWIKRIPSLPILAAILYSFLKPREAERCMLGCKPGVLCTRGTIMRSRIPRLLSSLLLLAVMLLVQACSEESTPPDTQPPAAIADLSIAAFTAGSITLCWTAPGDDSLSGTAARYDLRYSTETITDLDWDSAVQVEGLPFPQIAGEPETLIVVNLPTDTPLHFALKTADESDNWSGISNVVIEDFLVSFPDSSLEAEIRKMLAMPEGDIPVAELLALDSLAASNKGIVDLSGLEHCTNLKYLILFLNEITDVQPLAGLTGLEYLHLGRNKIVDIGPLGNLTNLKYLRLYINQIADLSPLAGLTQLEYLNAIHNEIVDIHPLGGLTNLEFLYLDYNSINDLGALAGQTGLVYLGLANNRIEDLTPLAGLVNLLELHLEGNFIADILPLVENAGLDDGDKVFLDYNPLSRQSVNEYIPVLQERGVFVTS